MEAFRREDKLVVNPFPLFGDCLDIAVLMESGISYAL
jgi:hypothetical protein